MADLPPGGQPLEPERSTRVPPPPGSAEEAAVIFNALSAQVWVSTPKKGAKPSVVVGTVLILVATVIALVIGAQYLRHVASSNADGGHDARGSTACAGTAAALGATETNLASALCAAGAYEAVHGESVQGIDGAALAQADPSLSRTVSFQALSATPDQISLALPVAGALVLTGFQPGTGSQSSTGSCLGVLRITASKAVPIFAGYPVTSQPGTYYFEAAAPGGLCSALTVDPPGGGSYLSSSGFPTTQLP